MSVCSVCQFLTVATLIPHLFRNWQVLNSNLRPKQITVPEVFITFLVPSRQSIWQYTASKSDKTAVLHILIYHLQSSWSMIIDRASISNQRTLISSWHSERFFQRDGECLADSLEDRGTIRQFLVEASKFYLLRYPQTGSGFHWASYRVDFAKNGWGVKLTNRLHLVPRLRKSGGTFPFPSTPSRRAQRQTYLVQHQVFFCLEAYDYV
jgi:hypothetical protein